MIIYLIQSKHILKNQSSKTSKPTPCFFCQSQMAFIKQWSQPKTVPLSLWSKYVTRTFKHRIHHAPGIIVSPDTSDWMEIAAFSHDGVSYINMPYVHIYSSIELIIKTSCINEKDSEHKIEEEPC